MRRLPSLESKLSEKTNYIITSAQYNAPVNRKFLDSLESYAESHNAEIIVIPMYGRNNQDKDMHRDLEEYLMIDDTVKLNEKVQVVRTYTMPQIMDPTTSQTRFAGRDKATIIESPKQRMRVVPNSVKDLPKVILSTGAITKPSYNLRSSDTQRNRIGHIAQKDHVYGAVVVEIDDANNYHFRYVRSNLAGSFVDLGTRYMPDGATSQANLEAMVLGDWHVGDTNPQVRDATFDMIQTMEPEKLFLHDFFNGHSISWFKSGKIVTSTKDYYRDKWSLDKELEACAVELSEINTVNNGRDIYLVKSNHDEWLDMYLDGGRHLKEPHNYMIGTLISAKMIEGKDALEEGIRMFWPQMPDNIHFLQRDDELKVWGYLLSAHGDKGNNGARATPRSMETAYNKIIRGHSHSPDVFRDVFTVGTSTSLNLGYNKGYASSWSNTHALLWERGAVQLVNILDGKWKGKENGEEE